MKIHLLLVTILMILHYANETNGANSGGKETKWFLFDADLFFIDSQHKFSAQRAQQFCVENRMHLIIQTSELTGLSKLLMRNYEYIPSLWVLEDDFSYDRPRNASSKDCYALAGNGIYADNCGKLNGLICKTKIFGGILNFKNGTHLEVDVSEVNRVCNPQSREYDGLLAYCMIKFESGLL